MSCLLAVAALVALRQPAGGVPPDPQVQAQLRQAWQQVGLTVQQKNGLQAILRRTQQNQRQLQQQITVRRRELGRLFNQYDFDRQRADVLEHEIHGLQWQLLQIHRDAQEQIRRVIVDPQQFNRFRKVVRLVYRAQHAKQLAARSPSNGRPVLNRRTSATPGAYGLR